MRTNFTSKRIIRSWFFITGLLVAVTLPSVSQTKHIVEASNTKFTPAELQIVVGDTVEWKNVEGYHNVNGTQTTYPSNPASFGNSPGNGWTYSHVFTVAGTYDYQCDPHVELGMVGKVEVKEFFDLTVNFASMNPHVGQTIWIAVIEKNSGKEIGRKKEENVSAEFEVQFSGIEKSQSYFVDFFADHNGNGSYDSPPVDHAWRLELDTVMGDTTLHFMHNTNFTDIMWKNKLTVHFTGMNPHVGQDLRLAVSDKNSGAEIGRIKTIASVDFMVDVYGIKKGMSYNVDFFADHNGNGSYDSPPADHAWRLVLDTVAGDTMLTFAHNTTFTDIMWKHELNVEFTGMVPHVGQMLKLYVVDEMDGMTKDTVAVGSISTADFNIQSFSLLKGHSYKINFFADHNGNGNYDAPPTDHAWQLMLQNVTGDTTLNFAHNTNFTDIFNTTSVSGIDKSRFLLYPNPATDRISIETGDLNLNGVQISIYDIQGRLSKVEWVNLHNRIEMDVQNLQPGIYVLNLKSKEHEKMIKWIKK